MLLQASSKTRHLHLALFCVLTEGTIMETEISSDNTVRQETTGDGRKTSYVVLVLAATGANGVSFN